MINVGCILVKVIIKDNNLLPVIMGILALIVLVMIIYLERKYISMTDNTNYREELFYSLGSNLEDVFVVYDNITKKLEYISPNFEKVFGVSSSKLNNNLYRLLDYVNLDQKKVLINKVSSGFLHSYQELEFAYHHPINHTTLWFMVKSYPIYKESVISRHILSIKDITKEHQARTAIREELSVTKKANEAKKDFLSQMSHELKTPINAILGMTQIASNSLDNPAKIIDCLDKINYSSRNLLVLIDNILENVKLDNDRLLLKRVPFSLIKTLETFSSLIRVQAEMKHQNYSFIYNPIQHDYLLGDSLRLTQILNNCLYNSLKFAPSGGSITLEVMELQAYDEKSVIRFIITDNGKGMHEEFLDQVFNAFVQEDETIRVKYGGSGLGMYIVKTLINLMDGDIHVESQVDQGTRITIDIGFERLPNPENSTDTDDIRPCLSASDKNVHILVVEDNEINLEITCELLKRLKYEHDTAISSEEAIKLFQASPVGYYDIILMDIQLPDADGYETAIKLRSLNRPDTANLKIIALSADDDVKEQAYIENGMNGCITKPVDIDKLSAMIQSIRY